MSIIKDILINSGIEEETCNKFVSYYELLIEWNEKINLTAITEEKDVALKHFVDCISPFKSGKISDGAKVIDVGTGAGFPGMVMKIYNESLNITLMDSLNKRINFLNEVIEKTGLTNIETIHSRAEELGRNKAHREKYDICVSRAVANLASLSELCLPFVRVGGYFISMKGPKAKEEIEQAKKAIKLCGGEFEEIIPYEIEGTDYEHNLVIIKKTGRISKTYPRKAPKPIKEPIL